MSDEKDEKAPAGKDGEKDTEGRELDLNALGGSFVKGDTDYEKRFMKDARQRAHDAELAALANLAIIRSLRTDRSQLLTTLELDQALNPNVVNRHLQSGEPGGNPNQK